MKKKLLVIASLACLFTAFYVVNQYHGRYYGPGAPAQIDTDQQAVDLMSVVIIEFIAILGFIGTLVVTIVLPKQSGDHK